MEMGYHNGKGDKLGVISVLTSLPKIKHPDKATFLNFNQYDNNTERNSIRKYTG